MVGVVYQWWQSVAHGVLGVSSAAPGSPLTQALVVGLVVGVLTYRLMKTRRYRLPPGPTPLPLLGNLLSMRSKQELLYVSMDRWARDKYGPVVSLYLGPVLCVFINDLDTALEALVQRGRDFAGRPYLYSVDVTEGLKGIGFSDYSPTLQLQRKISVRALRHYMTGSHLTKVVHEAMDKVFEKMMAEPGPFDPSPVISTLIFQVLHRICFGESRPYDDPALQRLIELFDEVNSDFGNGFLEDILPLLKYWPTQRFRRTVSKTIEVLDDITENIKKHKQRFDANNVQDVTDSILLAQMEAAKEESAESMAMFTDVHMRQTIFDLFAAGTDTTRLTLTWAVLFMAGHPEMQKRAQTEIDAVTGAEMPGVQHRAQLTYTQAVMQETMRMSPAVPFGLPHKTLCDTSVGGYDVPKNTMVAFNLWAITNDPRQWDQPSQFRPERFLDDKGELIALPKAWLPFSAGRRNCLGENMAKPELLILLACFLKRFSIALPEGATYDPSTQLRSIFIHEPKPFKIVITPR